MGMRHNFPGDPRLSDLPDEIRSRYRGRSVPSPKKQTKKKKVPVTEFMVAKTVIPIKAELVAGGSQAVFLAASDWVVQAIAVSVVGVITALELVSKAPDGSSVSKSLPIDKRNPVTLIEGFEKISFLIKAGETLSITSPEGGVTLVGSIELVQEGGKIIRPDDIPAEGPQAEDTPE